MYARIILVRMEEIALVCGMASYVSVLWDFLEINVNTVSSKRDLSALKLKKNLKKSELLLL